MKLILENEFTWDGLYGLVDETGKKVYSIDARIEEDGRIISICDNKNNELAVVRQKRLAKRPEYEFEIKEKVVGKISRRGPEYDIEFVDWFVTGILIQWNFRIVDKFCDIASSCIENECLALEYSDKKNALGVATLLMGIAGLTGDLCKEYSGDAEGTDLYDVIDTVEGIASTTARFGKKTLVAIEKLYDLYEEPPKRKKPEVDSFVHKTTAKDVAYSVDSAIDRVEGMGHKAMNFLDKLYGLSEEKTEDEGRE